MARQMMMTWVPARKRWIKKYGGKMYAVSCRALGTPETKDASWRAANAWWAAKEAELDAATAESQGPRTRLISALATLAAIHSYEQTGKIPAKLLVDPGDGNSSLVTIPDLGAEGRHRATPVLEALDQALSKTVPEETVGGRAEEWYSSLRASKGVARYGAYRRNLETFLDWSGRSGSLESITSRTVEGWHGELANRVTAGRYSPDYGRSLFGAFKKFVKWLAGHGLIALPANFDSTDFRFELGNRVTADRLFTDAEIKVVLNATEPRLRLFLLLMLNCGMYQSDVSDLTEDEVDWERGVITRGRSKTRRKGGVVVSYKLWPETFSLLQEFRNTGVPVLDKSGRPRVLLTSEGNPLEAYWIEDGKERRYDTLQGLWATLRKATGVRKALKDLRKTSANRLARHKEYRYYTQHFLAQASRSVVNEFYLVSPPDEDFFPALDWLGREYGLDS